ncbi:hypothetical protein [Sphingobacterium arenae]|uniref:IPT/TIG domain-containing protein n=1 Tax=Sphingobacterium arenae TaxID=1280598 RepID=A0ABR7Y440_9SPHI|nr:hypothetical protein [Sphingobacterium arenae]MBD1426068.1 hypothetical protein [Sphingobacterium arenae]
MNSLYISMRCSIKLVTLHILFIAMLLVGGCSKEASETPSGSTEIRLGTFSAENVNALRVTFKGEIKELNNEKILDHGFVFIRDYTPASPGKETELSLGAEVSANKPVIYTYQPDVPFDLEDIHAFYFYVKTTKGFYKGPRKTFEVDGLVIEQQNSLQATLGETIALKGDFSGLHSAYQLTLVDDYKIHALSYTVSDDKKSLSFVLPLSLESVHGSTVQIGYEKFKPSYGTISKTLANVRILGSINPPTKKNYDLNEPLLLTGSALPYSWTDDQSLQVLIGDVSIPYRREIKLGDIPGLKGNRLRLGFKNGRDSVIFPDPIELNQPDPSLLRFNRYIIHPFSSIRTNDYSFYSYFQDNGKYSLGETPLERGPTSGMSHTFWVGDIPEGKHHFSAVNDLFTLTVAKPIEVRNLVWNTTDKNKGHLGEQVILQGTFIEGFEYQVNLEGEIIGSFFGKNNELSIELSPSFIGKKQMKIGYYVGQGTTLHSFEKSVLIETLPFQIDLMTPLQGYPGDVVTLEGKGIGYINHILVGDKVVYPLFVNINKVQFPAPDIPSKGKVRVTLDMLNELYPVEALFEIL